MGLASIARLGPEIAWENGERATTAAARAAALRTVRRLVISAPLGCCVCAVARGRSGSPQTTAFFGFRVSVLKCARAALRKDGDRLRRDPDFGEREGQPRDCSPGRAAILDRAPEETREMPDDPRTVSLADVRQPAAVVGDRQLHAAFPFCHRDADLAAYLAECMASGVVDQLRNDHSDAPTVQA